MTPERAEDVETLPRPGQTVLLSINPEWAEAIIEGEKSWEYRKRPPAQNAPYRAVLYATAPVKSAVGEAWINSELHSTPLGVADQTVSETPHGLKDVIDYFGDRRDAYALHIDDAARFDDPADLEELRRYGLEPSQNFRYVPDVDMPASEVGPNAE